MRREDIRENLLSFYEGETSPEEERALYVYFSTERNLPEDLEEDKQIFLSLFESSIADDVAIPANLEDNLNKMLDGFEDEERNKSTKPRYSLSKMLWVGGVAASLVVGIFLGVKHTGFFTQEKTVEYTERDTFSNPEDAYKATEDALYYTSVQLNKVFEHLEKNSTKAKSKHVN